MKYDVYLFDLDGTLTDSKRGILNSIVYALKHFDIEVADVEHLNKMLGPPLHDSFREYFGFSDGQVDTAVAKYREYYNASGMLENDVYGGVVWLLDELRRLGAVIGMATSKPVFYAEKIAEHFDIRQYFSVISGAEMDGRNSKKEDVIRLALKELGKGAAHQARSGGYGNRAVMIGDRSHDIIGAKAVGIGSIGVKWGYAAENELEQAGADYIVGTPSELLKTVIGA
jgi:phosphoglycolate phosphatase